MNRVRIFPILLLLSFLVLSNLSIATPSSAGPVTRLKARNVLMRTHRVIMVAHRKVKQNRNFTGHLSKAYRHQKYARILFRKAQYLRAVHHSHFARRLAAIAVVENTGDRPKESDLTPQEREDLVASPEDTELEKELENEFHESYTDEDVINMELSEEGEE